MVYCGLYPTYPKDFEALRRALQTLELNDASFTFAPGDRPRRSASGSAAASWACSTWRSSRSGWSARATSTSCRRRPNVTYEILTHATASCVRIEKPSDVPDANLIEEFREPIARCSMIIPTESIGPMMKICTERRGVYVETQYLSPTRVMLVFDMPLQEIVFDFYDRLKSVTRGYGTLDYEIEGVTRRPTWCGCASWSTAWRSTRCP